jgi:hypothetical protein
VAKRSERPPLRPRVVSDAALAAYIGKSMSWLTEHRPELEERGFPVRLPIVGGNDLNAVDAWLDQLLDPAGVTYERDYDKAWMEAVTRGQN